MNENKIIQKLLEHDEQLRMIRENTASVQEDLRKVIGALDKRGVILQRLDKRRIFSGPV